MTEEYKRLNGLSPNIMNVVTISKHWYNTRYYNLFVTGRPKTDRYGRNSIPYRANQSNLELITQWNKKASKLGFFNIKN